MKLVVDVPEGNYKALKKMSGCGLGVYHEMILNGTPLSEELENIKAEMQVELDKKMESERQQMISCAMLYKNQTQKYFDIIDKHIAGLKGDNNAES